ncbi:MAG TPA: benzoate-CoA ligase family protein [Polyangia bacterium]|jgi:benzoate-CoA ligase family protein
MPGNGGRLNLCTALVDDHCARGRENAPAIREPMRAWSYGELRAQVCRTGSALRGLGVHAGERVALLLHDSCELAAALLGAVRVGALPTPMSVLDRQHDFKALLLNSGATVAIAHADLMPEIEALRAELPALRHVIVVGAVAEPGQLSFAELCAAADDECPPAPTGPDDPALLMYTSGTGGSPKGVLHRHATPLESFAAYGRAVLAMTEDDRCFVTPKKSAAYGLACGLCLPLAAGATTFLLPDRARPRTVFDVLNAFAPTIFCSVPSLYSQMLHDVGQLGRSGREYFTSVRHAVSGAEPLPPKLWHRVHDELGLELLDSWGATEAFHVVLANRPGEIRPGSSGRPVVGYEARVVTDDGEPAEPSAIGVLEVRGPTVVTSYHGSSSESGVRAFRGGWLHTNDQFFCDDDGYFWFCGRADGRLKVGATWVTPAEVEQALLAHPAVWECAVVGAEDEDGLLKPLAFVVPNVGHTPGPALAKEIMQFVKDQIAPVKYPRWVEFLDELPKSPAGKLLRHKLKPRSRPR